MLTFCMQKRLDKLQQIILTATQNRQLGQHEETAQLIQLLTTVKLRYNAFLGTKNRYVIGKVRCNQQGRKNADHVYRIAVQRFRLLLILPLGLIVIFIKIKVSIVDGNVPNGHQLLKFHTRTCHHGYCHSNQTMQLNILTVSLIAHSQNTDWSAPALVNRLWCEQQCYTWGVTSFTNLCYLLGCRGNMASISSNQKQPATLSRHWATC